MAKILLIADARNWIFDRHCNEIKRRITEHDFDIVHTWHLDPRTYQYHDYDMVYQLDPMGVPGFDPPASKTLIGLRNEFMYNRSNTHSITQFYNSKIRGRYILFHVVNRNQFNDFKSIVDMPFLLVQHGVDIEVFRPANRRQSEPRLVIGTSGNPTSAGDKGWDIINQACAITGCELRTAKQDFTNGHLSKEQMAVYYNSIDIYCCMSQAEGLNNGLMEAGATGLLVITTRTGAVDEIIRDGENGFIIDRSVDALANKIKAVLNNRSLLTDLGARLFETITSRWAWSIKIEEYRRMFQEGLTLLPPHGV